MLNTNLPTTHKPRITFTPVHKPRIQFAPLVNTAATGAGRQGSPDYGKLFESRLSSSFLRILRTRRTLSIIDESLSRFLQMESPALMMTVYAILAAEAVAAINGAPSVGMPQDWQAWTVGRFPEDAARTARARTAMLRALNSGYGGLVLDDSELGRGQRVLVDLLARL